MIKCNPKIGRDSGITNFVINYYTSGFTAGVNTETPGILLKQLH